MYLWIMIFNYLSGAFSCSPCWHRVQIEQTSSTSHDCFRWSYQRSRQSPWQTWQEKVRFMNMKNCQFLETVPRNESNTLFDLVKFVWIKKGGAEVGVGWSYQRSWQSPWQIWQEKIRFLKVRKSQKTFFLYLNIL